MKNQVTYLKNHIGIFIVIFGVSIFLVLPQILAHSLVLGSDSLFHFNRIYDIYMQYKTGNYNYFQTNYGFQQSGRIINAVYGPGFAYLLGGLLLIVHSWFNFQVVSSFLIFFISGYSMYLLSRKMASTKNISLFISILFMSSLWITRWIAAQNFMAWGISLMPLVVLIGIKMIENNADGLHVLPLALIVSVLIQVHVLSALMSICVLVIFFVIGLFQTNKKVQLLSKCFFAGLVSLVLTFNVWGAMLDVFTSNKLYAPHANIDMSAETMNLSMGNPTLNLIGLVMSSIFILQIILLIMKRKTMTLTNKVVTTLGLIFLVLTINLIPWTALGKAIPQLQSLLQFPFRFEGFASVLLLAGFGATLSTMSFRSSKKYFNLVLIGVSIFVGIQSYLDIKESNDVWKTSQSILSSRNVDAVNNVSNEQIVKAFMSPELGSGLKLISKASPDYLPSNRVITDRPYHDYRLDMKTNKDEVSKMINSEGELSLSWNATKKGNEISLPAIVYNNSTVQLNGSRLDPKKMTLSTMGSPTVKSTKIGINRLVIGYHTKIITRTSLIIVLAAWIISSISAIFMKIIEYKKEINL